MAILKIIIIISGGGNPARKRAAGAKGNDRTAGEYEGEVEARAGREMECGERGGEVAWIADLMDTPVLGPQKKIEMRNAPSGRACVRPLGR